MSKQTLKTEQAAAEALLAEDIAIWRAIGGKFPAQQLIFHFLWRRSGRRPGHVDTSNGEIAHALGRADNSIRAAMPSLEARGFVEVVDDRWGALRLYVNDPRTVGTARLVADSPQRELYVDSDEASCDVGETDEAQICDVLSVAEAQMRAHRSAIPAETAPQMRAHRSALSPAYPPQQGEAAQELSDDWKATVRSPDAQICERRSAPPKDNEKSTTDFVPITKEHSGSMTLGPPSADLRLADPSGSDRRAADERRQRAERDLADAAADAAAVRRRETPPATRQAAAAIHALADALDGMTPEQRRRKLRADIRQQLRHESIHDWACGRCADAVVFHRLPAEEMAAIVEAVKRAIETGGFTKSPGAMLSNRLWEAGRKHGLRFPWDSKPKPPQGGQP